MTVQTQEGVRDEEGHPLVAVDERVIHGEALHERSRLFEQAVVAARAAQSSDGNERQTEPSRRILIIRCPVTTRRPALTDAQSTRCRTATQACRGVDLRQPPAFRPFVRAINSTEGKDEPPSNARGFADMSVLIKNGRVVTAETTTGQTFSSRGRPWP